MNDNLLITIAYSRWKGKDSRFNDYTVYRIIESNNKDVILLNTDSKYELRMWLDLNNLKIGCNDNNIVTEYGKIGKSGPSYINFVFARGKTFKLINK